MQSQEARTVAGLPNRHAVLAAAATLLVAYSNCSLIGLAFLLLFFAWGLSYIRGHTRSAAVRVGGTIWGALAGGAAALLLGQIILQSIYAGKAGWATDPDTRRLLQLFGLTKAKNAKQIILIIAAPAIALAASLVELWGSQRPPHGPPPPQEVLLVPNMLERTSSTFSVTPTIVRAASYSNAGILAVTALALAALARPSLLSLPYLLLLCAAILMWSATASSPSGSHSMRVVQVYAGVHILVLYLWQIELVRRSTWQGTAKCLGLYHLSGPADVLAAQVVHLGALHVLFASLGFMAASKEADRPHLPASRGNLQQPGPLEAFSALWHYNERDTASDDSLQDPLLGYGDPYGGQDPPDVHSGDRAAPPAESIASRGLTSISRLLSLVLPFTAGALLQAMEGICRQPHLPATALVALALLQPSAISAAGLIIGLGALLIPSSVKRHPLTASSHFLCLAVLMWHLACYTATAVAAVAAAPKLAMSIGLLTFHQGSQAVLQLLAQVATAMALAALSRAGLISNDPDYDNPTAVEVSGPVTSLHDSIANYWHHGRAQAEPSYQTTAVAAASRSSGGDSAAESSALSVSDSGLTPIRTRVGQATPANRPPASLDDMTPVGHTPPHPTPGMPTPRASPWPALQLALGRTVYYLGFLALPIILFWVGLSRQDLLHGTYLALLVLWFLGHSLALEPRVSMGAIGNNQHWVLRCFATTHLVVMYLAVLTWLPGAPSLLHPPAAQKILEALGTWHPHVVKSMLPVLVALVLATLHANLGSWLEQQQRQRQVPILASPTAHPTPVLLFGKAAVSFGALIVVLVVGFYIP